MCAISVDSYYSFIVLVLLIGAVILLMNYLVLILYYYIHFLSLGCCFLYLDNIWTFIKVTLHWECPGHCSIFTISISHDVEKYFLRLCNLVISYVIFLIMYKDTELCIFCEPSHEELCFHVT